MFLVFFLKLQYLYNTYGTQFRNGTESICGLFTVHGKKKTRAPWLDVSFSALVKYVKCTIWLSFGATACLKKTQVSHLFKG